jgi:heme/copper-type cytochrome/quinol oxidase subunit 2
VSQHQAAQLTATQPPADQEAYDLTFVATLLFRFVFLALVTFATFTEQVSQRQTTQSAATHHPATKQQAQDLTFVAALVLHLVFLALVAFATFAKQVSQCQTTQPTAAQPAATEQHFQYLPVFTFDLGFVHSRFRFHV